jgi:hypothetical protein
MGDTENTDTKKEYKRHWIFKDFIGKGVRVALVISLAIFAVYTIGSVPDPGFPDRVLFLLLKMLRYSSLVNCAFSLFALGYSVHRLVNKPSWRNFFGLCFYFATGVFGAGLAMLDTLIIAASAGHV